MSKTRVTSSDDVKHLDKTDWKRVYTSSQSVIDNEAVKDKENPVLDNAKFKKLKK